jgi:NADPH:quinone reductase-like Zn-dependent oxidoreductase
MRVIRVHESGGIDTMGLDEFPRPESGAGEMLVAVKGAGVGPWDRLVREGQSGLSQTLPLTLGSEISAMVAMLGADVGVFALGDAVYGATNDQFDGEYALVEAGNVVRKPVALDYVTAAGVPVVAVTGRCCPSTPISNRDRRSWCAVRRAVRHLRDANGEGSRASVYGITRPRTSNGRDGMANVHFGDRLGSRATTHVGRNTI